MLKKRLIGVVVVRHGLAVQSIGFKRYLPIGSPEIAVDYLNRWGVDEITLLDITASREDRVEYDLVRRLSRHCRVPLSYGGGIKSADVMTRLVQAGADKVIVNSAFRRDPGLVEQGARRLGAQCVIASIDVVKAGDGWSTYDHLSKTTAHEGPIALSKRATELGAGEVFLNVVDRDGAKCGLDLALAEAVAKVSSLPLTLCGGVGTAAHVHAGIRLPFVSAVAAANYFNYAEHSVTLTKRYLEACADTAVRNDSYFDYRDSSVTPAGRLVRKSDAALKELLFEYHRPEVI